MDDDSKHKKAKETKKCLIKRILKFNDYKDSLFNNKMILKLQQSKKKNNQKWSYIPDQPYRVLIIWGSRSGKKMHYWFNKQPARY